MIHFETVAVGFMVLEVLQVIKKERREVTL